MGDGTEVICNGPGTPYKAEYGRPVVTDCGHAYKKSSAQARRQVHRHGDLGLGHHLGRRRADRNDPTERPDPLSRSPIGEAQVLVN